MRRSSHEKTVAGGFHRRFGMARICSLLTGAGILLWSVSAAADPSAQPEKAPEQSAQEAKAPSAQSPQTSEETPVLSESLDIVVRDGMLSVSLENSGQREVMEAISEQSNVDIVFVGTDGEVLLTDSFSDVPLEEGIRRLLQDADGVFVYAVEGSEQRLKKILVGPKVDPREAAVETPTPEEDADSKKSFEELLAAGGKSGEQRRQAEESLPPELLEALEGLKSQLGEGGDLGEQLRELPEQRQQELPEDSAEIMNNLFKGSPSEELQQLLQGTTPQGEASPTGSVPDGQP